MYVRLLAHFLHSNYYPTLHPFTDSECPELPFIPNGAITYGPDMSAPFAVDTVATHTCNEGLILGLGSEIRECLNTGTWSGLTPVCIGT